MSQLCNKLASWLNKGFIISFQFKIKQLIIVFDTSTVTIAYTSCQHRLRLGVALLVCSSTKNSSLFIVQFLFYKSKSYLIIVRQTT